jgi:hypothetical protein
MVESASVKRCPHPEHKGPRELPVSEFCKNRSKPDGLQSWCRACDRRVRSRHRDQVLDHYGRVCNCPDCGATDNLTIDHVNGDGAAHRAELFGHSRGSGYGFYRWLIAQGFPDGFQVLCNSCNDSKADGAACRINHADDDLKRCLCPEHEGPNPLPREAFSKHRSKSDSLESRCRACRARYARDRRASSREHRVTIGVIGNIKSKRSVRLIGGNRDTGSMTGEDMTGQKDYGRAVEIRLTKGVLIGCQATAEDGTTANYDVKSMDFRGAKREISEQLAELGYEGAGRWKDTGNGAVSVRKFRRPGAG